MENRRKHPRVPLISIVRLTREGIQKTHEAFVRDICVHGLGVYTEEAYEKGDLLVVYFSLVSATHGRINESMMGEVAWVMPFERGNRYAIGIRFQNMEKEKPKLYAYIKYLEEKTGRH